MASAGDVAALLMEKLGSASTMQLQKLLYYCQGWHLAWDGVPLFEDRMEAWANGPIVKSIRQKHRGRHLLRRPWPEDGDAGRLDADEKESVEVVLSWYGDWTPSQLALATHRERPWLEARGDLPLGARGNTEN